MTVATNVKTAQASLESAAAALKTFALATDDKAQKQSYGQMALQVEKIAEELQSRINTIQQEEPQYKGY
jgi:hypothetical protein